jgi:ParB family chromosome partitioning protein
MSNKSMLPCTHALKCYPAFYADVCSGVKKFELRKDDRHFRVGDVLRIEEYDYIEETLTGRYVVKKITYILRDFIGLEHGFCILGFD